MTVEQKLKIVEGAKAYLKEKNLSQADFSAHTKINQAYLSHMLNGKFVLKTDTVEVEIADKWFMALAEAIGLELNKNFWGTVQTVQFTEIIGALESAKQTRRSGSIICDTGMGKTYLVEKFCMKHPNSVIRVKASKMHKLADILNEIMAKLRIPATGTATVHRLNKVIHEFKWMHRRGEQPMLIIDEAENMHAYVFAFLKALYDGIDQYCPIVLIGTEELTDKMLRLKRKNKDGMPQFYRRFKAGTRLISKDREFHLFYNKFGVEKPLQKLLNDICENYGELHDFLAPVIQEADETGQPLTEDLFRKYHNMPKYSTNRLWNTAY